MQQQIELPDKERRDELKGLIKELEGARTNLSPNADSVPDEVTGALQTADSRLAEALAEVRSIRDEIPEWDRDTVQELVLEHSTKRDTEVRRVDNEVVFTFEVGAHGDKEKLRYSHVPGGDSQWLHVDTEDGWEEVWSN